MNSDELRGFVPWFLELRYPGQFRPVVAGAPETGWILDTGEVVAFVRAGSANLPFIWFRGGIAHGVPRSEALALHVASQNKDLMVGRVYLSSGEDRAMVVFDEAILAGDLDPERQTCANELVTRFGTSIQ